jgi:hypothetical protein
VLAADVKHEPQEEHHCDQDRTGRRRHLHTAAIEPAHLARIGSIAPPLEGTGFFGPSITPRSLRNPVSLGSRDHLLRRSDYSLKIAVPGANANVQP